LPAQTKKPICDSAISVCPKVFDKLVLESTLSKKYYSDNIKLLAEKQVLLFKNNQKDSLVSVTSGLLNISEQNNRLSKIELDQYKIDNKYLKKQVKWLKFGCISFPIIGVATTLYVVIKK